LPTHADLEAQLAKVRAQGNAELTKLLEMLCDWSNPNERSYGDYVPRNLAPSAPDPSNNNSTFHAPDPSLATGTFNYSPWQYQEGQVVDFDHQRWQVINGQWVRVL
jgi:hypothetical protein